jgi:hypothetical protein
LVQRATTQDNQLGLGAKCGLTPGYHCARCILWGLPCAWLSSSSWCSMVERRLDDRCNRRSSSAAELCR